MDQRFLDSAESLSFSVGGEDFANFTFSPNNFMMV